MIDTSHSPLSNTDGPNGPIYSTGLAAQFDPLNTATDRTRNALPMTPDELEAWSTAADDYTGPRLVAFPGYDYTKSIGGLPYYDLADDGIWRDTLTREPYMAERREREDTPFKRTMRAA